ncbi:hypothetical protein [Actinomadura sp. 9N407]|uniref:hypothetical protein n=1 Tax=Actinomadura sp. 9N407 TaxID=3375154 RepID=UPI00378A78E0
MPTSAMNPHSRLVENATAAVDAYLLRVLPNRPPEAQAEDHSSVETLHCLFSDLLHFCDHHGLDFDAALGWARTSYADDLAMEQTFTNGDEVQPRHSATWRGIVVDVHTTDQGQVLHTVRIPGERDRRLIPVEALETEAPFGPIETRNSPVLTAQEAEGHLEELSLLIRRTEHEGRLPAQPLYADQRKLVDALADWSRSSPASILQLLGSQIAAALDEERLQTPEATKLASTAFPNDIASGLADPRSTESESQGSGSSAPDGRPRSR